MDTTSVAVPGFSKRKRNAACLFCLLFLLTLILTSLFLDICADHKCTGEDCGVCGWISHCEGLLHLPGIPPEPPAAAPALRFGTLLTALPAGVLILSSATLVSLKIRLNT